MGDAKAVADAFLEAFNAHDEARIRELNGENAVFEGPGDVRLEGREAATEYAMSWLNAFGDARITVHDELVAGDWVVQEFVFEGRTLLLSKHRPARFRRRTGSSEAAPRRFCGSKATRSSTRGSTTTRCS